VYAYIFELFICLFVILFRLVASIQLGVRCINVFNHNSLRNKGDSLAAAVGHVEPSISRKLDVVIG